MPKKKTVLLINHEGLQDDPKDRVPWSDTWVEFYDRRKKVHLGPTFLSTTEIDSDRELFGDDPECDWYVEPQLPDGDWLFCLPYGEDGDDKEQGIPHIAVNSSWITGDIVKVGVEWYLRRYCGVTAPIRFRWKKHKKHKRLILIPGPA